MRKMSTKVGIILVQKLAYINHINQGKKKNLAFKDINQLVRLHFNNCLIWNSGLYTILWASVREQQMYVYILAALGGGWRQQGYTQSIVVAAVWKYSPSQANQKRSPPSWVFTTDRKAYVSSGAFYFLKTRHRHAVVVVVFKAYVDNHVWRTLWWSFWISISGSATIFCCRIIFPWNQHAQHSVHRYFYSSMKFP